MIKSVLCAVDISNGTLDSQVLTTAAAMADQNVVARTAFQDVIPPGTVELIITSVSRYSIGQAVSCTVHIRAAF